MTEPAGVRDARQRAKVAPRSAPDLLRTALVLLPLQMVFRGGEAILPLFLAAWFGRSVETDFYYLLSAYFVFAAAILTSAFQDSAAIAVLIEVGATGEKRLFALASSLLGHTLVIGSGIAVVTGLMAAFYVRTRSRQTGVEWNLVLTMSVCMIAIAIRAFFVGLLNSRGVFKAHPIASGVGMAFTFTVLVAGKSALGVRVVPVAALAGELVAIGILAAIVRSSAGLWLMPTLERSEPLRRIFSLVRLETAGALITRVNPVIDQWMAGLAGVVGGGTLVRYAGDVASLPTSILQATLFPVLLTRLSLEGSRPAQFRATTQRTLSAVVGLLGIASAVLIFVRRPLCVLLFAHGTMDAAGVDRISAILPWAALGVAPFGALLVLARAHVALQNSRIMPSMGVLNSVSNALLNALFVGPFGLPGIALSTSVTYLIVAIVFWIRLPPAPRGLP